MKRKRKATDQVKPSMSMQTASAKRGRVTKLWLKSTTSLSPAMKGGEAHDFCDTQRGAGLSPLLAEIRERVLQRSLLVRQQTALTNAIKAVERRLGRAKDQSSSEFHAAGATLPSELSAHATDALELARGPLKNEIRSHEKHLEDLMEQVFSERPEFGQAVLDTRGIGILSAAQILGHIGDLGNYANPAKVWKRMGLAVIEGKAQRKVAKNSEVAKAMGFSPERRACMHVIGENLVRLNDGQYRKLYDDVKPLEREKMPDASDMHVHRRAMRKIEKRLLLDLWKAWKAMAGMQPTVPVPPGR